MARAGVDVTLVAPYRRSDAEVAGFTTKEEMETVPRTFTGVLLTDTFEVIETEARRRRR